MTALFGDRLAYDISRVCRGIKRHYVTAGNLHQGISTLAFGVIDRKSHWSLGLSRIASTLFWSRSTIIWKSQLHSPSRPALETSRILTIQ